MKRVAVRRSLVRVLCLVALVVNLDYLTWRALHTFNAHAPALSLLLFAAECYGLVMFALHVFLTWDTRSLERRFGLGPDQTMADAVLAPPAAGTVDVFIPTYDESVALLRKTVLAARELRLPHATWVLDDGRRDEVRTMCDELGVGYLTRDSNEHAKAGNINAALASTSGEFVVVLDADFIALPNLLERTLGHFEDEKLAFVQLPQAFYNVDSVQHVDGDLRDGWHEQSLFYDVIQPGKNRWDAAFWCGSPAVVRRAALESVGGAATSTITEDILTSMRMHAAGWRSLYHNEVLAVGVAPGDLDGFRTQRLRWAQGSMQILRSRENPLLKPGLTVAQRLNYLASMTTYFQALQLAVFVAMPVLILATGQSPISNFGPTFFLRFVPYMLVTMCAVKATGGSRQRLVWDQYFSFLRMFTFLRALPTLVTGGRGLRFRVTPKGASESAVRRSLYPHLGVALLNVAVVSSLLAQPVRRGLDAGTLIAVCVAAGAIATVYAIALLRLWRRVYRRHHYRVHLALPASLAVEGGPELLARTQDISFGGLSLVAPAAAENGARVRLRLLEREPLAIVGTVVSCTPLGDGRCRLGIEFAPLPVRDEARLLFRLLAESLAPGAVDGAAAPSALPRSVVSAA
jgi:cellulose synthase (UDP-forming)